MFGMRRNKEEHRYYLLPGMGRSNRRRHQQFFKWGIIVGLLASAVFGYLLYLLSQFH
jgi:high-affinity Fe2+/Pb2+ permease